MRSAVTEPVGKSTTTPEIFIAVPNTHMATVGVKGLTVQHSDSRFESIRFATNRNVRFDCTVCRSLSLSNHRLTDYRSWHNSHDHDTWACVITHQCRQSRCRLAVACWHHFFLLIYCPCYGHWAVGWGNHILWGSTPYTAPSQATPPSHL